VYRIAVSNTLGKPVAQDYLTDDYAQGLQEAKLKAEQMLDALFSALREAGDDELEKLLPNRRH